MSNKKAIHLTEEELKETVDAIKIYHHDLATYIIQLNTDRSPEYKYRSWLKATRSTGKALERMVGIERLELYLAFMKAYYFPEETNNE